jgi:SWI/SNF-related matrix-associated actin-dependent regulator 1 of chromatin subfamily A
MACDHLFRHWATALGDMYGVPAEMTSVLPDIARAQHVPQSVPDDVLSTVAQMMIRLAGWTPNQIESPHPIAPMAWYRMAQAMLNSPHPTLSNLARTVLRYAGECHWTQQEQALLSLIGQVEGTLTEGSPPDRYWDLWKTHESLCRFLGTVPVATVAGGRRVWRVQKPYLPLQHRIQRVIESYRVVPPPDAPSIPAPEGKHYTPFQRASIDTIIRRRHVLLADEPGLGKTIQAIGVMNALEPDHRRLVLVVCPAFLCHHWRRMIQAWDVHQRVIGNDVEAIRDLPPDRSAVVVLSYERMVRSAAAIQSIPWDMVVFDEAHYLKNPQSKRSKVAWKIRAYRTLAMTGTPMLNRPRELWPYCQALDPQGLGRDWKAFHQRYCGLKRTRWGWEYNDATNVEELSWMLRSSFMIARQKAYITDIPPKHVYAVVVEPERTSAYRRAQQEEERILQRIAERRLSKERALADLDDIRGGFTIDDLATLTKTRQIVGMAKAPVAAAHASSLIEQGKKVVIATWHRDVAATIHDTLAARLLTTNDTDDDSSPADGTTPYTVVVTGDMDHAQRQRLVDTFQTDPQCVALTMTMGALGMGVTLTAASHILIAELPWTPAMVEQTIDRIHRIGQTGSVTAQLICADGTVDGLIASHIAEKQEAFRTLMQ